MFDKINQRPLSQISTFSLVVFGLIIVIMLNVISDRYCWRADTNASQSFRLSTETVNTLNSLNYEVDITVFDKKTNSHMVTDLLNEFQHVYRRLNYQIIDPDENPELASQYNITRYGCAIVQYRNQTETVNFLTEESLINALSRVVHAKNRTIAFVTGHGERGISNADRTGYANVKIALEKQAVTVSEIILAGMDSIPENISAVVVAGPVKEYFAGELALLTNYLKRGGSILFLMDPKPGIGLRKFLLDWGVEIGNDIIVDASGFGRLVGAGPEIPLVSDFGIHPITANMDGLMTFFPLIRSVTPVRDDSSLTVVTIARTGQSAYAMSHDKTINMDEISIGPKDHRGPIDVACAILKNNNDHSKTRIVVVGDSDFASNAYFTNQANGDFFLNIINWLVVDEHKISIDPAKPDFHKFRITLGHMRLIFWLVIVIMPVFVFSLAVVVHRSRH